MREREENVLKQNDQSHFFSLIQPSESSGQVFNFFRNDKNDKSSNRLFEFDSKRLFVPSRRRSKRNVGIQQIVS